MICRRSDANLICTSMELTFRANTAKRFLSVTPTATTHQLAQLVRIDWGLVIGSGCDPPFSSSVLEIKIIALRQ